MTQSDDVYGNACCTPRSTGAERKTPEINFGQSTDINLEVCNIPGGTAMAGTNHALIPIDEESPCRVQEIPPFKMMNTAVTNKLFKAFVEDTGYETEAERLGWSFVFYKQLPEKFKDTQASVRTQWWRKVDGACWNRLVGPDVPNDIQPDHPVVHVSWNDAKAFAEWAGGRLPTELEWEHAARGGLGDVLFPWGNTEPDDFDYQPCNIWQGEFPIDNLVRDGYAATAPAKSFEPNGYGLYNLCGNVWEWTSGRLKINGRSKESKQHAKHYKGTKLLKGGSFLCHKSYCFRYRIAARTGTSPDTSTTHQGFRLVF